MKGKAQDHYPEGLFLLHMETLPIHWVFSGTEREFGREVSHMRSYTSLQFGSLTVALEHLNKRNWLGVMEVCDRIVSQWPEIPEAYEYRAKAWNELGSCCQQLLAFEVRQGGDSEILKTIQSRLDECGAGQLNDEEEAKRLWEAMRSNLPNQK